MKIGVVMDPLATIPYKKDSTLALLFKAQSLGHELIFFEQKKIFISNGIAFGQGSDLTLFHDEQHFFQLSAEYNVPLAQCDLILMRKDPPFNMEYIYSTYILEIAEKAGARVLNRPASIRDANEKIFASQFSDFMAPTLVTSNKNLFAQFFSEHKDIVLKPLDGMGGENIFRLKEGDVNASQLFQNVSERGAKTIMLQKFIPEIDKGDKRIIFINGKVVPHVLARIPGANDWRGNLVQGATAAIQHLSARDKEICAAVGPVLKEKGLFFVGLDVIGDYLTEINVTSPTGIREIEAGSDFDIGQLFFDEL